MYEFASKWLVWIAFIMFIGGIVWQLGRAYKLAEKDKVIFPYMTWKHSLRSLGHWLVPFATKNMRMRYETTIVTFAFHIAVVLLPIFLAAHVVMFNTAWGVSWPTLSVRTADILTVLVLVACVFFLIRRWMLPEVRFVTFASDYVLLGVVAAPFLTGFIARMQWVDYDTIVIIHMLTGCAMLIAIPFTRLSHMIFFPFTRAYMGSEFGAVRNSRDW